MLRLFSRLNRNRRRGLVDDLFALRVAISAAPRQKGKAMSSNASEAQGEQKKQVKIIVEGTPHDWPKDEITYAQVVTLFDPAYPQHPQMNYSVTYERGQGNKPEDILPPGGSVKVKEGMVFHVSQTGES